MNLQQFILSDLSVGITQRQPFFLKLTLSLFVLSETLPSEIKVSRTDDTPGVHQMAQHHSLSEVACFG